MVDLDALARSGEEALVDAVHGQGHVVALRVPVAVGACGAGGVGLGLHPRLPAVLLYHRTTAFAAYLHRNAVGIGAVGRVAVEAAARHGGLGQDGVLAEGVDVALVDADVAAHLVAGLDAAVGQPPVVERGLTDVYPEVAVLRPLAVLLGADGHGELAAPVLAGQLVPLIDAEVGPLAVGVQLATLRALHHYVHAVDGLVGKVEVQRGDVGGDGHADVVGVDVGQLVNLCGILRMSSAS